MSRETTLDGYNHTELYQTCLSAGILVRPNESCEAMREYLLGDREPPDLPEEDHPFHAWRHAIASFLSDHWKTVETQLTCPARHLKDPTNPNPRPCFSCTDTQVSSCLAQNPDNLPLIESHRLNRSKHK